MNLQPAPLEGRFFTVKDPNTQYQCIGYGQPPDAGTFLIVGTLTDANTGKTTVRTFPAYDVTFV